MRIGKLSLLSALVLQAGYLGLSSGASQSGLPHSLGLIGLALGFLFILLEQKHKLSGLGVFIAPAALFFFLVSSILFHIELASLQVGDSVPVFGVHLFSAIAALVFFGFSFVLAIGVLVVDRLLRRKKLTDFLRRLPPLGTLTALNLMSIRSGFILMLVAVVSGVVFTYGVRGGVSWHDPKLLWSLGTSLLYLFTLVLSERSAYGGRKAAWLSICSFGVVVTSLVSITVYGPWTA